MTSEEKVLKSWVQDLRVDRVRVGSSLSVHVEAAIFMWEYVRKRILVQS